MSDSKKQKILYIDRDGTLIFEPSDGQIDRYDKFALIAGVIPALLALQQAGFLLIMVTNQDGLGTASYAQDDYQRIQTLLLQILTSQGIHFHDIRICPHFAKDHCECRKPKLGLIEKDLIAGIIDPDNSYVIGDRQTDIEMAQRLHLPGFLLSPTLTWSDITKAILQKPRTGKVTRHTKETQINVTVNLDEPGSMQIATGIGFFDHMLEQIAKHAGISCTVQVTGDLHIDDHHTVEDTGLALGAALAQALSDKLGIQRYGFLLPMDESLCEVALDLSGRPYYVFEGQFPREKVGELATELVPHFFRSLCETLKANCHMKVTGDNAHHMVESCFKAFARALRSAITRAGYELPSTKGTL